MKKIKIGIIGDYDPQKQFHAATMAAIDHAAAQLALDVNITWIPTPELLADTSLKTLEKYDALWASPGTPYKSMEGALRGIKQARVSGKPFIGT